MEEKVQYYNDELNDEFSGIKRKEIKIDEHYKYTHNFFWRFISIIVYRIIMTPIAYLYMKFKYNLKVKNKKILKKHKKDGYFIYANHTLVPADGYIPSVICFPKRVMVVVNAENISLKGTRTFMEMIGAFPIANHFSGMRNFKEAMEYHLAKKRAITIYPEAHIWPYYTKIRNFKSVSFSYPVKYDKPVYSFTVTYQKGLLRTNITAYLDGPFYPNKDINSKASTEELRNNIYAAMVKRSENSTYEKIKYIKKGE